MRPVENSHPRAVVGPFKRKGEGPQRRGKLLVGESRDDHPALDEGEVRDRFHSLVSASPALAGFLVGGGVWQLGDGVLNILQGQNPQLAAGTDGHNGRIGAGTLPAHDRQVGRLRGGVDGQVNDPDLIRRRAQDSGHLGVQLLDLEAAGGLVGRLGRGLDGDDGGRLRVGDKQDPIRAGGQRPDGLEPDIPLLIRGCDGC